VNILISNKLSGVMMLFHARYPNDVLFAIKIGFASFKGGCEGAIGLGRRSGFEKLECWSNDCVESIFEIDRYPTKERTCPNDFPSMFCSTFLCFPLPSLPAPNVGVIGGIFST
jgi:hypothetical protein